MNLSYLINFYYFFQDKNMNKIKKIIYFHYLFHLLLLKIIIGLLNKLQHNIFKFNNNFFSINNIVSIRFTLNLYVENEEKDKKI
jgi:hypothetical protein